MNQFTVKDCTLLTRMSGLAPAINLRELRDRLAVCSENVLYHHFYETLLVPQFDYPDYRNDFAVWARHHLRDNILGERLGIIDPYGFASLQDLRTAALEIIDEHLSERVMVPWAPPGHEFYFMEATTVVFDTGARLDRPEELSGAIGSMSGGSVYFHFLEARRRPPLGMDDFSAWLSSLAGDRTPYVAALQSIDFPFYSLAEIRKELVRVLTEVRQ
jgi:hypothetical protein